MNEQDVIGEMYWMKQCDMKKFQKKAFSPAFLTRRTIDVIQVETRRGKCKHGFKIWLLP